MLQEALDYILKEIWSDIRDLAPHEISLHIGNSAEHVEDPYGSNIRDWTVIHSSPDDNHLYILANPAYFRERLFLV